MEAGLLSQHQEDYAQVFKEYSQSYDPWFGAFGSQYIPLPLPQSTQSCIILPIRAPGKGITDKYDEETMKNAISRFEFFESVQRLNNVIRRNATFIRNFSLFMMLLLFMPLIVTFDVLVESERPGYVNILMFSLAFGIPCFSILVLFLLARRRRRRAMQEFMLALSEENLRYRDRGIVWRMGFAWIEIQTQDSPEKDSSSEEEGEEPDVNVRLLEGFS